MRLAQHYRTWQWVRRTVCGGERGIDIISKRQSRKGWIHDSWHTEDNVQGWEELTPLLSTCPFSEPRQLPSPGHSPWLLLSVCLWSDLSCKLRERLSIIKVYLWVRLHQRFASSLWPERAVFYRKTLFSLIVCLSEWSSGWLDEESQPIPNIAFNVPGVVSLLSALLLYIKRVWYKW